MPYLFENLILGEGDERLLAKVRAALESLPTYVLWLQGEMGAGKTSFVRNYLYALGLPAQTPVVSPTYTLMNEYKIGKDWYAHLDLYRADARFSIDELGIRDVRAFKGTFIEWPEQAGPAETIGATHLLRIEAGADESERRYSLLAY